jgi:hypothetical protein
MPTQIATRWLKTDPRTWNLWPTGTLPLAQIENFGDEFVEDARSALDLLNHLVVCAGVLDSAIEAESCPVLLRDLAQAARRSFRAWVPIPVSLEQRLRLPDITTEDLEILRAQLREAIIAQEKAESCLLLARGDAEHLRLTLAHEREEAREDFRLMRGAAGTMRDGAVGVRLLGSLLDRARNWVQDPVLRAEITKHCPPTPRTEADHG